MVLATLLLGATGAGADDARGFFAFKRAGPGGDSIPFERYLQAHEHVRRMPPHSTAAVLGGWTPLGPGNIGGRTRALVVDPTNPNVMFAGGVAFRVAFLLTQVFFDVFFGPDFPLGSRVVTSLAPGATSSATTSLTIPSTTPGGTYRLRVVVDSDAQVSEADETNNDRLTGNITILGAALAPPMAN